MKNSPEVNLERVRSLVVISDTRTIQRLSNKTNEFKQQLALQGMVRVLSVNSLLSPEGQIVAPVGMLTIGDGIKTALPIAGVDRRVNRIALVASGFMVDESRLIPDPSDPVALFTIGSNDAPFIVDRQDLTKVRGLQSDEHKIEPALTNPATVEEIVVFMGLKKK